MIEEDSMLTLLISVCWICHIKKYILWVVGIDNDIPETKENGSDHCLILYNIWGIDQKCCGSCLILLYFLYLTGSHLNSLDLT